MVLTVLSSTIERVTHTVPLMHRSQLYLSSVHPLFGNALFFGFTLLSMVLATLFIAQSVLKPKRVRCPHLSAFDPFPVQRY